MANLTGFIVFVVEMGALCYGIWHWGIVGLAERLGKIVRLSFEFFWNRMLYGRPQQKTVKSPATQRAVADKIAALESWHTSFPLVLQAFESGKLDSGRFTEFVELGDKICRL